MFLCGFVRVKKGTYLLAYIVLRMKYCVSIHTSTHRESRTENASKYIFFLSENVPRPNQIRVNRCSMDFEGFCICYRHTSSGLATFPCGRSRIAEDHFPALGAEADMKKPAARDFLYALDMSLGQDPDFPPTPWTTSRGQRDDHFVYIVWGVRMVGKDHVLSRRISQQKGASPCSIVGYSHKLPACQ